MCLSKAYIARNGQRELIMEEVASVSVEGDRLLLRDLFGEERQVPATIHHIDFMTHTILLEGLGEGG